MASEVEKYRKPVRILHWVHMISFIVLLLTGLVLYLPGLGGLAEDSWTRVIHRIGAVVFIVAPLIYTVFDPASVMRGIKTAFTWGKDDLGWLKAAPAYYFSGDEKSMPPQGAMNTGQKMWWFITLVFGALIIVTGLIMWFAKTAAPGGLLQWMTILHDVAFIVAGCMLFVHIYLAAIHPLMTEAWKAITKGTMSAEYARSHHELWYNEVKGGKKKEKE